MTHFIANNTIHAFTFSNTSDSGVIIIREFHSIHAVLIISVIRQFKNLIHVIANIGGNIPFEILFSHDIDIDLSLISPKSNFADILVYRAETTSVGKFIAE